MYKKLKNYIFYVIIILLVFGIFYLFNLINVKSENSIENNIQNSNDKQINEVDIGRADFELFRQVIAYSYKYFPEDFNLKDKLNKTIEKVENNLNYLGYNINVGSIDSNNLKDFLNEFEVKVNEIYDKIKVQNVDINKTLSNKNLKANQVEVYSTLNNYLKTYPGYFKFVLNTYCSTLDPYTSYMGPKEYKVFNEGISGGNFSGIGVAMSAVKDKDGEIIIIDVFEDTPAFRAGLKPGDKIVKVDGKEVKNYSVDTVQSMIRGPKGSEVNLTIRRGKDLLNFKIIRDIIHIKSTKEKIINKNGVNIGYIRISSFNKDTSKEFWESYNKLNKPNKIIIDLRNNGGGLLDEAVNITSYFVPNGKLAVYLKTKNGTEKEYYTKSDNKIDADLVILVNNYTASASEILAQSLKDLKKDTIIIGTPSYGKNSVQTIFSLMDGGVLKLTIAKYFTLSNRDISKEKVSLDYKVEFNDPNPLDFGSAKDTQLKKAIEVLSN
ncbi:MAG: S41 family peptidase [bacterium]